MNKIKNVAVVAAMVGGMGLLGGGLAHADGQGDFTLNNVQPQNCNYNALIPVQIPVGLGVLGSGTATAVGQSCTQSGPSFSK
ncbi:hypothetical protein ABT124_51665 [Streptomyces sp. NPDC001982]|uniref:hypothetical protein n=1 Tax=Streptomyces sp. NPDC001982 TaxID=3154405 RepID=UPI003330D7E4